MFYIFLAVFQKLKPPTLGQGDIQTAQGRTYIFLAVFQKLKPSTLGHGVTQTVEGGGLHFSSSVSETETYNNVSGGQG